MHFDYCTTASLDFVLLDQTAFSDILEVCFLFHQPTFLIRSLYPLGELTQKKLLHLVLDGKSVAHALISVNYRGYKYVLWNCNGLTKSDK